MSTVLPAGHAAGRVGSIEEAFASRGRYVVLSPALKAAEPVRFAALFQQFAAGYARTFHGDEAESTGEWQARIAGKAPPQPVMRIVVAVADEDGRETVVGGLAAEYYRAGGCMLVTYVYVLDATRHRHRGHARALIGEAVKACQELGPLRALLAEAEWPELLRVAGFAPHEVAEARRRLGFFARIGARMLNIDYVQPPLAPGQLAVSHLKLFVLPTGASAEHRIDDALLRDALHGFLAEFYAALAQEARAPADTATLARLQQQVAGARPLTSPLPRLRLEDVAACFHFLERVEASEAGRVLLEKVRSYRCPVLHSMETDLLSRAYRTRRVFRSVCLTQPASTESGSDAGIAVEITFPRRIHFFSENRTEERHWPLRRRVVRAYLAPTFFLEASLIVWHLVLKSDPANVGEDPERWFDELDLIALLKLADDSAGQESQVALDEGDGQPVEIARAVRFRVLDGGAPETDLQGLLRAVGTLAQARFPQAPVPQRAAPPRAATVQILRWPARSAQPFFGITDLLEREALCGIITAIFDFDEIDDAEARDTLNPTVPLEEALMRVHGGVLVYVAEDDRAARTVGGTVGISPYLIIPHAAVLTNEHLLEPFQSSPGSGNDPISIRSLSGAVKTLEDTMRRRWVPNAFFYDTERRLYESALAAGGTKARRADAEELLLRLKTNLQLGREAERDKFEAIVAGMLGAISVLALDPLAVELVPWIAGKLAVEATFDAKLLGHGLAFLLATGVALATFWWKRPRRPKEGP